ncbi:MAG: hypothetical protein NXY57DRAFT_903657, partial [Lentinula lateritia]
LWIVDHIETLPTELNSIWRKEFTGISVLFLVNRYMFLLFIVMEAFQNFPGDGSDMQCHTLNIITTVFQSVALVTTNALFALRVYAIYNKNKVILGVTFVFIISRFVFDILVCISTVLALGVSTSGLLFQSLSRCGLVTGNENEYNHMLIVDLVQLVIPFLTLGFDIFIFILTAKKTVHHTVAMQRIGESSITHLIIRDGEHFRVGGIPMYVNEAQNCTSCTYLLIDFSLQQFFFGFVIPFFNILPNLLIGHLVLNLRTFPEPKNTMIQGQQTHISSLHFASNQMLGNIGAPLDGESFIEEEEEGKEGEMQMENIKEDHERFYETQR